MKNSFKQYLPALFGTIIFIHAQLGMAAKTWGVAASEPSVIIDHSPWDKLLKQYLSTDPSGLNLFDYATMSEAQFTELTQYVESLENADVSLFTKAQQKAFWINLYNALTVKTIVAHYPIKSIKDISFGLLSFGPWDEELVKVSDKELSLNDIEHEILRPIFEDSRIHYAVNCAAIGCPNLQTDAFTAENTESLLDQAAKQFINHPRGVRVEDDELVLSSIYNWYEEDFGEDEEEVIEHIKQFAKPELVEQLTRIDEVEDYQYDWCLNQP